MAKSGAKKRLEENRAKLKFLSDVLNGAMALHVVVRVVLRWKSVRLFHLCVFVVTALACRASLGSLRAYAKPTFGENGEVLDGGESLSGGLTEYYQDLIYVGAFAMATSTYSDRFWLVTLIVPLVAGVHDSDEVRAAVRVRAAGGGERGAGGDEGGEASTRAERTAQGEALQMMDAAVVF